MDKMKTGFSLLGDMFPSGVKRGEIVMVNALSGGQIVQIGLSKKLVDKLNANISSRVHYQNGQWVIHDGKNFKALFLAPPTAKQIRMALRDLRAQQRLDRMLCETYLKQIREETK